MPPKMIYSAVDVTQNLPIQKLTASSNPIVYKYGIPSTTIHEKVVFKNIHIFKKPDQPSTLRI